MKWIFTLTTPAMPFFFGPDRGPNQRREIFNLRQLTAENPKAALLAHGVAVSTAGCGSLWMLTRRSDEVRDAFC
jgi:hypothetical protein